MAKKIIILLLFLGILSANAQSTGGSSSSSTNTNSGGSSSSSSNVNNAVAQCLSTASTTAGVKAACIQSAIATEENNQITTLYNIYTQFVSTDLANLNSGGQTGAPPPGAGASTASPTAQPKTSPPPPPVQAPSASPFGPRQNRSGIQYY